MIVKDMEKIKELWIMTAKKDDSVLSIAYLFYRFSKTISFFSAINVLVHLAFHFTTCHFISHSYPQFPSPPEQLFLGTCHHLEETISVSVKSEACLETLE